MRTQSDAAELTAAVETAIEELSSVFNDNPLLVFTEAELHSYLYGLLTADDSLSCEASWGACCLVHQEYPTPFRCDMPEGRFEVAPEDSALRRGHYDLVVLNPHWVQRVSREALRGVPYRRFCEEIKNAAQPGDPPLCVAGIEMHLVRSERLTKTDHRLIGQDYRKLLFSGVLSNGWRFMQHRYMLVYSHHARPGQAEWKRLQEEAARGAPDLIDASVSVVAPSVEQR